jgi:DNA polymerase I
MLAEPAEPQALDLLLQGSIAMSDMEETGLRIDVPYYETQIAVLKRKEEILRKRLVDSEEYRKWKDVYGTRMNIQSGEQLASVLFDHMGYEPLEFTEKTGRPATNAHALGKLRIPFVSALQRIAQFRDLQSTFIGNILSEQTDGILHPHYNLHLARTYRSSSSAINFQNQPNRDPFSMRVVRGGILPLPGFGLIEYDFKGMEVSAGAGYHHDPMMIKYLLDSSLDMHRDMACEIFFISPEQCSKVIRYCAKNRYVFPEFYGDWYQSVAQELWSAIEEYDLTTTDGIRIEDLLRDQEGITSYAEFEKHIQKVEDHFWNTRFARYTEWKEEWFEEYLTKGWFRTLTGFICQGAMKRNAVINYPVQGSAFHILLWAAIQINRELRKRGMRSRLCGQIHDALLAHYRKEELDELNHIVMHWSTRAVREHWEWINVPLILEGDITEVDEPWSTKREIDLSAYAA